MSSFRFPSADFAVIGLNTSHSLSPRMHSAAYKALGLEKRYVAIDVPVGRVGDALEALRAEGFTGVNVTVPHKAEALAWCETTENFARRANAVNTIRLADRYGINTDGPGFMNACSDIWPAIARRQVLLMGAGGSARAVAISIADAGFTLRIWNRTRDRGQELAAELPGATSISKIDLREVSLLINATSSSLAGESLEIDWSQLEKDCLVFDLMYSLGHTPFLKEARAGGATKVSDGRRMLMEQGALSFEFWLGISAPREIMLEAIGG